LALFQRLLVQDHRPKETKMSDPNFRDPRLDPPPIGDDIRSQRLNELESSNAMWGWVAGAVVLALVLVFVFTRGQVSDTTASNVPTPPAATTGMKPLQSPATPAAPIPATPSPSTTGQGNNQ
jgi:hypothetical protein